MVISCAQQWWRHTILYNHRNSYAQVFIIQFYIVHLIIFEWKRKFNSLQSQYIVAGKTEYSFNSENRTANKSMLDVNKGGGNFHSCYTVF